MHLKEELKNLVPATRVQALKGAGSLLKTSSVAL